MSEWEEALSTSSFSAVSCTADMPLSSEIDFWTFSLSDEILPLMVAETSVMRFSMVAQTSDLIRFTSALRAAMAASTVYLDGSSTVLSSASGGL